MSDDKVKSLSEFMTAVRELRESWRHPDHRELWFRGESERYETFLRPELYRPRKKGLSILPPSELLAIENDLYEYFQRCGLQLLNEKTPEEYWDWDSYFLMQHHGGPTRLLDWSDGALAALHFAVRNKAKNEDNPHDAVVYVLEPYRLDEQIKALPDIEIVKTNWKAYVARHPSYGFDEDEWERAWLPSDEEDLRELSIPVVPFVLEFPHITRRVAAQRSRFMVFGTEPNWLAEKSKESDFPIKEITIDGSASHKIRVELRDSGITESVIYPDLDGLGREIKQLWKDQK